MNAIVGIPACTITHRNVATHGTPARYGEALIGGAGVVPLLIPPVGAMAEPVLERLDGLLLSGSPSNVEPRRYGGGASLTPDLHDPARDDTTLGLIRLATTRGLPLLAICRGIQELNVAFGGTLHQAVHTVAGRQDHRGGSDIPEMRYRPKHEVTLQGSLARIVGRLRITVNSVHGQAIDRVARGLAVEALADDGTIEGVRVESAAGFALGVQWHPEWRFAEDPASMALFGAFGEACRAYAGARRAA